MKKFQIIALVVALVLIVGVVAACTPDENLKGVTEDTIWVGNTAGSTGALAAIGGPFEIGIEAAFYKYNQEGGFNGKQQVKLKHYDDGGNAEQSKTLTEQLLYDDEVFAIVGNFAANCVAANLQSIKDADALMVYAAAGNDELFNANAKGSDRKIMPVQPLNNTEGRSMILRAVAPVANGGFAAKKVGVIANNGDTSQAMLAGINAEKSNLPSGVTITVQTVADGNYATALAALRTSNVDVVLVTVVSNDFLAVVKAMSDSEYYPTIITTFNNANASLFYTAADNTQVNPEYTNALTNAQIYAQAWIDITSATYVYNKEGDLLNSYKNMIPGVTETLYANGVSGFNEEYWSVAETIYNYCKSVNNDQAFAMSYNSYALAGYIAGDLFCQGLKRLEESGKELTRNNYTDVMEQAKLEVALGVSLDYANGKRAGVEAFALNQFTLANNVPSMGIVKGLASLDSLRNAVK